MPSTSITCRVFSHYKGYFYAKMFERVLTDTQQTVVVYRAVYSPDGTTWCRPKAMFDETTRFKPMNYTIEMPASDGMVVLHTETNKCYTLRAGDWQLVPLSV